MKKKKNDLNNDIRPEYDLARMKGGVRGKYVKSKRRFSQLALAQRDRLIVRFTSQFDEGSVSGYVLDIGPRFFLIALIAPGIRFSGFQCFRLSDVRGLKVPDKYAAFYKDALKKRGQRIPKKSPVSVRSLEELLLSASRTFPLITINREKADPDVCNIGRVAELSQGYVSLLEIGPDARWDKEPTKYRISEITRVDFGGDYEDALHLVGGVPRSTRA